MTTESALLGLGLFLIALVYLFPLVGWGLILAVILYPFIPPPHTPKD